MAIISKDLGPITAYAAAVNRGYTGSREEFETLMASYAYVGEQAAESATNAGQSAQSASQSATDAQTAQGTAQQAATDAQTAQTSAQGYAQSAQQSAQSASQSAQSAESAKDTAVDAVDGFAAGAQQALDSVNSAGINWKSLAQAHALDSEAWSVGTRGGEDVGAQDETYHNNSKWYAEQGGASAQTATEAAQTATTKAGEAQASASAAAESARTLTIDRTLTQPGQAADAFETGNKITSLKEDLNQIIVDNKVIPTWYQGYINTSTGATGSDPNYCYCDYIEATGFTYKITGAPGYNVKVALYNASKVFDSIAIALTADLPVTLRPDKGTFFRIQYGLGNASTTPSDITDDVFGLTYASFTDATFTMSGKSADAKVVGDAVSAFKNGFEQINKNIINEYTGTLSVTGAFVPFEFSVFEGKKYKMTNQSIAGAMLAYTRQTPTGANVDNILGGGTAAGYSKEFTATADASYIVVYVNTSTTEAKFSIEQLDNIPDRVSENEKVCEVAGEALSYTVDPKDLTSQIGVGVNASTGVFSGTDSTNVVFPDYIEINKTTVITNHNETRYVDEIMTVSRVFFYDASKQHISNAILLPLESATIPSNAKYVRFSYTYLQTTMTETVATTFNTDVESKILSVKNFVNESISIAVPPVFYVGANRVGVNTFKTLKAVTEYIWNNNINGATVYVDRGTYDLVAEYDSDYLEGLVDPGSNPRALGLKCGKNTRFIFESGAKILFDYSGENTYVAQMFSPINIAGSCIFENMQIEARNCRYCVHEDYYTIDTTYVPYTVQYINCDMLYKAKTLEGGTNGEPIGAGCMPGSTSIIDGGKYVNEVNQADISYHNYAMSSFGQGISKVFIKNVYMSHWCSFGDYGDSVVYGYISGCRMKSEPIVGNPDAIITKWGNTIET